MEVVDEDVRDVREVPAQDVTKRHCGKDATHTPSFSWPGMGTAVKKRRKTSQVNSTSIARSDTNHVSSRLSMSCAGGERHKTIACCGSALKPQGCPA